MESAWSGFLIGHERDALWQQMASISLPPLHNLLCIQWPAMEVQLHHTTTTQCVSKNLRTMMKALRLFSTGHSCHHSNSSGSFAFRRGRKDHNNHQSRGSEHSRSDFWDFLPLTRWSRVHIPIWFLRSWNLIQIMVWVCISLPTNKIDYVKTCL